MSTAITLMGALKTVAAHGYKDLHKHNKKDMESDKRIEFMKL